MDFKNVESFYDTTLIITGNTNGMGNCKSKATVFFLGNCL